MFAPICTTENFPSFFGGAFIEACEGNPIMDLRPNFPSYLGGLSLRRQQSVGLAPALLEFPFLFGRAFIEATTLMRWRNASEISLPIWEGFH